MSRVRRVGPSVAAAACLAALGLAPSASAAGPVITLDTGLTPAFSTSIPNYTTRCASSGKVNVSVVPAAGYSVAVDGGRSTTGATTAVVPLNAGQRFRITVRKSGRTTTASIRCLPEDFPAFEVSGRLPAAFPLVAFANIAPVVFSSLTPQPYAIVADRNGVPVWWRRTANGLFNVMGMKGGYIAGGQADGPLVIYRPNGTIVKSMRPTIGDPDAHEAIPTSRGTFYLGATSERSGVDLTPINPPGTSVFGADSHVLDSNIEEVSASGRSLWSWRSADHFATAETLLPQVFIPLSSVGNSPTPTVDIAHINSIEDDGNGGVIASFRNTSAVYGIDKATGAIRWKLGGTPTPQSLTVIGDPGVDRTLGGQHDARLNPDGTVSIFDNAWGTNRSSRVTRWRIDPASRTATLVEQFSDPEIGKVICCGSARRGADGSWLVGFGANRQIRAYSPSKSRVFTLRFTAGGLGAFSYRATPIPTSQVTEATLIGGMDSMNRR